MQKHKKKSPTKIQRTVRSQKKHSKEFMKVYWPYLPLFVLVFFGLTFGYDWRTSLRIGPSTHHKGVLAYATEMSASGLLSATNSERSKNGGIPALALNSKLSSAAQAKANDMVARNYWSHTTPDGKDPWVFIDATGYAYQKAGENLAYGFSTSNETVAGWMNSPSHKANMLDSSFKEVGFGFANSASYVGTGEETIIVAMYANPSNNQATSQPSTSTTGSTPATKTSTSAPSSQPTKQDTTVKTTENNTKQEPEGVSKDQINQAVTSDSEIPLTQPATTITKLQSITSGRAPWSAAVLSGVVVLVVGVWVIKHAILLKRVVKDGESFVLHHPAFDVAVLIVVAAAILLSQSSGVIK